MRCASVPLARLLAPVAPVALLILVGACSGGGSSSGDVAEAEGGVPEVAEPAGAADGAGVGEPGPTPVEPEPEVVEPEEDVAAPPDTGGGDALDILVDGSDPSGGVEPEADGAAGDAEGEADAPGGPVDVEDGGASLDADPPGDVVAEVTSPEDGGPDVEPEEGDVVDASEPDGGDSDAADPADVVDPADIDLDGQGPAADSEDGQGVDVGPPEDTGPPPCTQSFQCSDGDLCNGNEICDAGTCLPGAEVICDDGKPCNGVETCNPITGCKSSEPPLCNDGNVCNGLELCHPASGCVAGEALECDDEKVCNGLETCDPWVGCVPGPPPEPCCLGFPELCEDGDPCNGIGECEASTGTCYKTPPLFCDDGNDCNGQEACDPLVGCQVVLPGLVCDDGEPCTLDLCDPLLGCLYKPQGCILEASFLLDDLDVTDSGRVVAVGRSNQSDVLARLSCWDSDASIEVQGAELLDLAGGIGQEGAIARAAVARARTSGASMGVVRALLDDAPGPALEASARLFRRSFDADCVALGPATLVWDASQTDAFDVDVDAIGGAVVAFSAWEPCFDCEGAQPVIRFARFDAAGTPVGGTVALKEGSCSGESVHVAVADQSGAFVVSCQGAMGPIHLWRHDASGTLVGEPGEVVPGTEGGVVAPGDSHTLGMTYEGVIGVIWATLPGTSEATFEASFLPLEGAAAAGIPVGAGAGVALGAYASLHPKVQILLGGEILLPWSASGAGLVDRWSRFAPDGEALGTVEIPSGGALLAVDAQGTSWIGGSVSTIVGGSVEVIP